jgi:chromosome segregation ATPase
MAESMERIGGSLLNLILGGVILWVGQTTFHHSGLLAGVDEKFRTVDQQFTEVDKRHESIKKWLENVVNGIKENNDSIFTAKDGDRLIGQLRQAEFSAAELERRVAERLSALEARFAALETTQRGSQEVATLQWEVAQLRDALTRTAAAQAVAAQGAAVYPSADRTARGAPVFLPPVDSRR